MSEPQTAADRRTETRPDKDARRVSACYRSADGHVVRLSHYETVGIHRIELATDVHASTVGEIARGDELEMVRTYNQMVEACEGVEA